jgi:hypothetical protein
MTGSSCFRCFDDVGAPPTFSRQLNVERVLDTSVLKELLRTRGNISLDLLTIELAKAFLYHYYSFVIAIIVLTLLLP